jgi:hypothetical protein
MAVEGLLSLLMAYLLGSDGEPHCRRTSRRDGDWVMASSKSDGSQTNESATETDASYACRSATSRAEG